MANPIKINDKGGALTCDEYDDNLDILQDRANHVGTQSCSTISDLDSCLATSSTITGLEASIDGNTDRIFQLETDLSAGGGIIQDLNNLEATLTADIQQNTQDINILRNRIDLEIVPDINSNSAQIGTVNTTFTNITDASNGRIATLELWRTTDEPKILNNNNRINTINNVTLPGITQARVSGDATLTTNLGIETNNRILRDNQLENLISDESNDRAQAVNTVDNKFTIITDALDTDLDNEIQDREDGDTILQAQINNLNAGLSGAIPTATILPYAGFNAPPGFLMCRGDSYDRNTYSDLFNVISTRYGSASSSTFNVPDMRGSTVYGSFSTNLNTVPTTIGQNSRVMLESEMPRHEHPVTLSNHVHTLDYKHSHGLFIHPHTHLTGTMPDHTHGLQPYRQVALGGGSEDSPGAELTSFPANDPDDPIPGVFPNTAGVRSRSSISAAEIKSASVSIYPPPFQGVNKTDEAGTVKETSASKSANTTSGSRGGTGAFDVRQKALVVNYIIKT